MKSNILLIVFILFAFLAQAQKPCGTPAGKSDWLTKFQQDPNNYIVSEDDTILYVPMTVHVVGTDAGAGYFAYSRVATAICQLNVDFEQANIQFFLENPIHYINNSSYNVHSTVVEGAQMMFENDVPNTLNSYFVDDPAGNCGYNLPYASIALKEGCSNSDSHTWAHEIGHAFTLPHPFLGWEGKTYMAGDTAPVKVTYDYTYFKDTLILDTLIIDTTFVELVDGSNCTVAADGFCDTPPDYLSYRWQCNNQNTNGFLEVDPNGDSFMTNGELFMSYALDECQSKFSEEQIIAMRSYILNEKPNYLYNQTPLPALATVQAELLEPAEGELTDPDYTKLVWTDFGPDASYHLVVAKALTMSLVVIDTVVTDTTIVLSGLENRNYFWKVHPFNKNSFCTPNSDRSKFTADDSVVSLEEIDANNWRIQPSIVSTNGLVQLVGSQPLTEDVVATIMDVSGQRLQEIALTKGQRQYDIALTGKITPGIYFLLVRGEAGFQFYQKLMIY